MGPGFLRCQLQGDRPRLGCTLTLCEALLWLLAIRVLLGLLLGVLLRGFVVSCAADGGVPVWGRRQWLLWEPQGHVTPGFLDNSSPFLYRIALGERPQGKEVGEESEQTLCSLSHLWSPGL